MCVDDTQMSPLPPDVAPLGLNLGLVDSHPGRDGWKIAPG